MNFHKLVIFLAIISSLFMIAACGGGGGDGTSADITAPITTASPGAGVYSSIQYVTLTANETATIYYSIDGADPSVGGANTTSGISPITDIEINNTTLKFFAIDSAGNQGSVKTESYTIDLLAPSVSFTTPPPDPFGILTSANISWQSDEDVDYIIELGGTGSSGTGLELDSGSVSAYQTVTQEITGTQLSFGEATSLWVYITDQVGHIGSSSLGLSMKPLVAIPTGGGSNEIEILPGGEKAYISNTYNDEVSVIDTDPLSATYHTEINTVSVGIRPMGIAITPDGSRVYVSNNGNTASDIDSVSIISSQTDTVIDTTPLGSATVPGGIAITPDGTRAYFTSFENKIYIIDTDPESPLYNLVVNSINMSPLLLTGKIGVSPDGKNAVVNWQGTVAHAVDVLDVDPSSAAYNTMVGNIVPIVQGGSGSVAFSADSKFVYFTSPFCGLCMADLNTFDIISNHSDLIDGGGPPLTGGIALTPDDIYLLLSDWNYTKLYIFDASDLTLIGNVDLETQLGNDIAITPDGTRAYILRNPVSVSSEVVMVPLQ